MLSCERPPIFGAPGWLPENALVLAGAAKYLSYALPHLLEGCKDKDANVRQCSVYGLGVLAQMHQEAFRPSVPTGLMHILSIITAPDAR